MKFSDLSHDWAIQFVISHRTLFRYLVLALYYDSLFYSTHLRPIQYGPSHHDQQHLDIAFNVRTQSITPEDEKSSYQSVAEDQRRNPRGSSSQYYDSRSFPYIACVDWALFLVGERLASTGNGQAVLQSIWTWGNNSQQKRQQGKAKSECMTPNLHPPQWK